MKKYLLIAFICVLYIALPTVDAMGTVCAVHRYWEEDWEILVEPTETSEGIKTCKCRNCGQQLFEEIPRLSEGDHEHEYGEWQVTRKPTSTSEGQKQRTCSVCGAIDIEAIPFDPFTDDADQLHVHVYGDWQTTVAPTATTEGKQIRMCTVSGCSVREEKSIPATGNNYDGSGSTDQDWWEQAFNFWHGGTSDVAKDALNTLEPIMNLVKQVGNMIFVAVTVMLGVKYIWGGVDSKASVKDSLPTLIVAALVFYGWNTISAIFMNSSGNNLSFIGSSVEVTAKTIYATVMYIMNFLAVGGIVYLGVRYMMAGAEGRAQLKTRGVPVVLGIIMVYATITFLNLIVSVL